MRTIEFGLGQNTSIDRKTILPIADIKGRDGWMVGHLVEDREKDRQQNDEWCQIPQVYMCCISRVCALCVCAFTICIIVQNCFHLFSYVESTAVSLRVEPATAKCFPQDWVVWLFQTLENTKSTIICSISLSWHKESILSQMQKLFDAVFFCNSQESFKHLINGEKT